VDGSAGKSELVARRGEGGKKEGTARLEQRAAGEESELYCRWGFNREAIEAFARTVGRADCLGCFPIFREEAASDRRWTRNRRSAKAGVSNALCKNGVRHELRNRRLGAARFRPGGQVRCDPNGSFVDSFGTSFSFSLCGEAGTDLCGVLTNLEGESATEENLAFVGKQVMQAEQSAPNQWKGSLSSGGISADATITMVDPDTIEIQGCRAVMLCQTLAYRRT
jgi:hypothetical protein